MVNWLAHAVLGSLIVLVAGSLAVRVCGQPARRVALAALTVLGAAVVPWLGMLTIGPGWSTGIIPAPVLQSAAPISLPRTWNQAPGPFLDSPPVADVTAGLAEARPSPAVPVGRPDRSAAIPWAGLFVVAHLAATSGFLSWWLLGVAQLRWLTCRASPAPAAIRDRFDRLSGPGGRRVQLRVSDLIAQPITFTWTSPVILIPEGLASDPGAESLDYALAHEWSHVERGDFWAWNLVGLAGSLLFYQPLYWWLRRQVRLCQDYLADDRAAAVGSAEDYAACLVRLARFARFSRAWPALGISDRRSNLARRVLMLVREREPLDRCCPLPWSLAATIGACALVVFVSQMRLGAAPPRIDSHAEDSPSKAARRQVEGETLRYSGRVTDSATRQPIEGATVVVRRSLDSSVGRELLEETRHQTDASGTYRFTISPEQAAQRDLYLELDASHPDHATQAGFGYGLSLLLEEEKQGRRPFFERITLRPAQAVTGRVETPDGGPAEGVEVIAHSRSAPPTNGPYESPSLARTRTDATGRFRLPILTPGLGVVWILSDAHAPEMHILAKGQRGELGTFTLRPGIVLKGRAYDAQGKPLAGLDLQASRQNDESTDLKTLDSLGFGDQVGRLARTDADGRFEMAPLPPGKYRVEIPELQREGLSPTGGRRLRPLREVFLASTLVLGEQNPPGFLEIRASPHVVFAGRWVDSRGNPARGWECLLLGRVDGDFWHIQVRPDPGGKFTVKVPHGLEHAQFNIDGAATRYRIGKDGPLKAGLYVMLGTLDHDVSDFEIVRYKDPTVTISATTKDGKPIRDLVLSGLYTEEIANANITFGVKGGLQSEVQFERQRDGRYRSDPLTPDRAVKITAQADGFKAADRTFKLAEGKTEEAAFVLEPEAKAEPAAPREQGTDR